MKINYQVIAVFTASTNGIKGNPSAVVYLDKAVSDEFMQKIAAKLNQPATTFIWKEERDFKVRWFAPDAEIMLCGHGTAAAGVFLGQRFQGADPYHLQYKEGTVSAEYLGGKVRISLDAIPVIEQVEAPLAIREGLGIPIKAMYSTGNKHLIMTDSQEQVQQIRPDFSRLRESDIFGYAVTAPGNEVDFVSRTFVPHVRQLEDFATGSSHAALVPFWAEKLGKTNFRALQLSDRGGAFDCELVGDQVFLSGQFEVENSGSMELSF